MTTPILPTQYRLYGDDGYDSHVVCLLLEEKSLDYQYHPIKERPEFLADLNPYNTLPILTTRDLTLYEINIIFEYLEERHKATSLLPDTPQQKAQIRLLAWRLQQDWLKLGRTLLTHPDSFNIAQAEHAKKSLSDSLITLSPLFARQPFFMSEQISWCDLLLAPLLWRLPDMGLDLPCQLCRPLLDYGQRLFDRPAFARSLNPPIQEHDDDF